MKIRLIAIALTMLMIISGFAVLVSYAPANNSIPVSPYVVGSNDTLLYEYQINNTGSAFTNGYFPFTFTDENLFIFNTTNSVVQNVKFLYSNGTQIKGFIPTGQTGLPNTDQGSGNWLVYFTNFSMTAGQIEDIYMQVFPANESVLNANFSTSTSAYIGITNLNDFSDTSLWHVVSNSGATVSSTEITMSSNQNINVTYVGSALPDNINFGYTLGYDLSAGNTLYETVDTTYLGANVSNVYYGDGVTTGYFDHVLEPAYYRRNLTSSAYGDEIYTLTTGSIQYQSFSYTYVGGDLNWTDWTGKESIPMSSLKLGFIGGQADTTSGSILYLTAVSYWDISQSGITQKSIGTVTSITPTASNTGNYILFNETGLPYGQSWNMALTNKTANVVNSVYASTTNTVKAFLPTSYNYSFSFSTFDKSYYKIVNLTGNVYLSPKANATVNVTLTNVSYDVIFHESGIVSGNAWGIDFNGTDYNTTSASLTFIEKNGSYPFTVIISKIYDSNVSLGTVTVNGAALNIYIGFTYRAFNITFSEVGLPSNVQWSMTIDGTVYYSNVSDSNILLFQGKAGSYDGIVDNATYYTPMDRYFNFTITGNAQYTIDYGIILTFIESGYNGLWHITINGVTYSSSTNTIVATVSPGQVVFNVWGASGYTINPEVVTQSYTSAQTIRVTFTVQPASFENVLISTPMVILYFILAIMTMAGVVYWRLKHER
jgi:hypothetical protein